MVRCSDLVKQELKFSIPVLKNDEEQPKLMVLSGTKLFHERACQLFFPKEEYIIML